MIDTIIAETTEYDFKVALETKKPKSWLKSVSAFANGIGGTLIFGVSDNREIIGIDNIHKYELELREYAINKLKSIDNIIIYNEDSDSGIIAFNYKDIFAQDLAIYLNKYKICVRAGNHCAKMLKEEINIKNTCRISLYFYNTKEEIDYLINEIYENISVSNFHFSSYIN